MKIYTRKFKAIFSIAVLIVSSKVVFLSSNVDGSESPSSVQQQSWDQVAPPFPSSPGAVRTWVTNTFDPWIATEREKGNPIVAAKFPEKGRRLSLPDIKPFLDQYPEEVFKHQQTDQQQLKDRQQRHLQEKTIGEALERERQAKQEVEAELVRAHDDQKKSAMLNFMSREEGERITIDIAQKERWKAILVMKESGQKAIEEVKKAQAALLVVQAAQKETERKRQQDQLEYERKFADFQQKLSIQRAETVATFVKQEGEMENTLARLTLQLHDPTMREKIAQALACLERDQKRLSTFRDNIDADATIPELRAFLTFYSREIDPKVFEGVKSLLLGLNIQLDAFSKKYLSSTALSRNDDIGVVRALQSFMPEGGNPNFQICRTAVAEAAAHCERGMALGGIVRLLELSVCPHGKTPLLHSLIMVGDNAVSTVAIKDLLGLVNNTKDGDLARDCQNLRRGFHRLAVMLGETPPLTPLLDLRIDIPSEDFCEVPLTKAVLEGQIFIARGNLLWDRLQQLEDPQSQIDFIRGIDVQRKSLEETKNGLLNKLKGYLEAKANLEDFLMLFKNFPTLSRAHSQIKTSFDRGKKGLQNTYDVLVRVYLAIENEKFSTDHREELISVRGYFQEDIVQFIEDYKVGLYKILPQIHLSKTIQRIQKAINAHEDLLRALNDLKEMWPFSIEDIPSKGLFNGKTEIDPLVHDLIDKVHHLLKQHFIDKKSYLSLSSTDRATQYQHALKALGEDITDSSVLEPELKNRLLLAHTAYNKARDAIKEVNPLESSHSDFSKTDSQPYQVKGFKLELPCNPAFGPIEKSSAAQGAAGLTSVPPPPPPPPSSGRPPLPPSKPGGKIAPPPPPPPPGGKPTAAAPSSRPRTYSEIKREETAKWQGLYGQIAADIEGKTSSSEQESLTQEFCGHLEKIIFDLLKGIDVPPFTFEEIRNRLLSH